MVFFMLPRLFFLTLLFFLCSLRVVSAAAMSCVTQEGLEVCVQARGPVDLYHLLPHETTELQMDMFFVTVKNQSARRFRIDPVDFVGITEKGQKVRLDVPLFQSIELRTKLRKTDLGPGERVEGHLFFPSYVGRLQAIVHQARPYMQIRLY
mgnify:CR=1 FL=1